MARHVLTTEERLRGVRAAIRKMRRTKRGPVWLIPSMERHAEKLQDRLDRERQTGQPGSGR